MQSMQCRACNAEHAMHKNEVKKAVHTLQTCNRNRGPSDRKKISSS